VFSTEPPLRLKDCPLLMVPSVAKMVLRILTSVTPLLVRMRWQL